MGYQARPDAWDRACEVARRQHGVVARAQLLELGAHAQGIKHRVARGRLHQVRRGVYAFAGELTLHGHWMGAVLSGGPEAALSDTSAAQLWEIVPRPRSLPPSMPVFDPPNPIHVAVPGEGGTTRRDLVLHRRRTLEPNQVTRRQGVPVTKPVATLVDVAAVLDPARLERAINEADKRHLVDPERLRAALDEFPKRPGLAALKRTLDSPTFAMTDTELESRFLPLARKAGLPMPETQAQVNGFRVDFFWPALGLVVETDGLTYHRTPAEQARDRVRDQVHTAAGLTCLRFTRAQVRFEPEHVEAILAATARCLTTGDPPPVIGRAPRPGGR